MRGRSPVSRLCSPPEVSAKRDHLAQGLRQLPAQEVFQPFRAPGRAPDPLGLVPGEMPGPAHRRGEPDLTVGRMLVDLVGAPILELQRQYAADELDIQPFAA